jgi:DNA-binding NarL/FixJ family response regulator
MVEAQPIRIVVVDDHAVIRDGLRAVLAPRTELNIVACYGSGEDAVANVVNDQPDVVLLDVRLPGMDGLETLAALRAARPATNVLMLSSQDGEELIYRAVKMGAVGYVLKVEPSESLVAAITAAARGRAAMSADVSNRLAQRLKVSDLSSREIQILGLIADGQSNQEIARALGLSHNTVKNHIVHVMEKLNANDRTHAVTIALSRGIIRLD